MTSRVQINPQMFGWAMERAGRSWNELEDRFPRLQAWARGEAFPTLKQLESFAKAVHVPIGYLFFDEPPEEPLPVPDMRTVSGTPLARPSPNLLDTLYAMQRRQAWLREDRIECEAEPLDFVGNARMGDDPEAIGREMRRIVVLGDRWAAAVRTWEEAVSELRRAIEQLGVMAVINGVVGNNTHRILDVEEFRGFALCDEYAPLVFVNGADAKSAQMFTLAHELAHIWLGASALTDAGPESEPGHEVEVWCNRAAAEFLVPAGELIPLWRAVRREEAPFEVVARRFKVSPVVAARRAMDLRLVEREAFFAFYRDYTAKERGGGAGGQGGNYYYNQNARIGEMFALEVFRATKGGRLSFKEAYDLTGLRGGAFQEYAHRLGVVMP